MVVFFVILVYYKINNQFCTINTYVMKGEKMNGKIKILLVDNEQDFCFFLKINLEETGVFEVRIANDGMSGVELARTEYFDVILLDIVMPEMSGAEVGEILSSDSKTKQIPIIFLTAMVDDQDMGVASIKEIGGNNFISKTAGTQKIAESIKNVLGR